MSGNSFGSGSLVVVVVLCGPSAQHLGEILDDLVLIWPFPSKQLEAILL